MLSAVAGNVCQKLETFAWGLGVLSQFSMRVGALTKMRCRVCRVVHASRFEGNLCYASGYF